MKDAGADILIIGGGVIGLSVAYHLGRQGAKVTVLDSGEPGQASPAAAGMLAPLAEASGPGAFLDFALQSLASYPDFAASLREDSGLKLETEGAGLLRVARDDAEEAALCRAMSWQAAAGLPLHRLTGTEMRRLEPASSPAIQAAVLSPAEKTIDPRRLLPALSAACRRHGVETHVRRAVGLEVAGRRVRGVQTEGERFVCHTLVVTGGAWSRAAGEWLGLDFPVTPLRGQILALGPRLPSPLRHTLYTHGAYLVPRADGRIVAGATEEQAGFASETTETGIAGLRADAVRLLPALAGWQMQSAWAGLRPVCVDGLPLLGRLPGWDNAFLAAGHGRNGILLAPWTGALLAETIFSGTSAPAAFDPARFGAKP